jgi:hypothetical protein
MSAGQSDLPLAVTDFEVANAAMASPVTAVPVVSERRCIDVAVFDVPQTDS